MTKLRDGRLADLFRNSTKDSPELQALSYAVLAEKRRLMDLADKTRTMSMIDSLPENILDVLAVELRTPYYDEGYSIEVKREVIRNSVTWSSRAGTAGAAREMVAAIFGSGGVVEWFDFDPADGEIVPGEFDIESGSTLQDPSVFMAEINRIISRVKNTRSHLRNVRFLRIVENPETPKILAQAYSTVTIPVAEILIHIEEA